MMGLPQFTEEDVDRAYEALALLNLLLAGARHLEVTVDTSVVARKLAGSMISVIEIIEGRIDELVDKVDRFATANRAESSSADRDQEPSKHAGGIPG